MDGWLRTLVVTTLVAFVSRSGPSLLNCMVYHGLNVGARPSLFAFMPLSQGLQTDP